jgi:UDP-N-acetylglucosamine 2-epimerase (non-hydrolysing)
VVQGDTISTLIGGFAAKLTKKKLLHIEAGYRSGRFFSPFPEELTRRIVSKLADVHFAPTEKEFNNLISEKVDPREIVRTYGNTAIDNIFDNSIKTIKSKESFCLVTLHRTELLSNRKELTRTLNALIDVSKVIDVLLVADSRLLNFINSNQFVFPHNFTVKEKLNQSMFHQILRQARLVITDSGGVQQEMEILGVPTIIHRKVVENIRNSNIYHTKMDPATLIEIAINYENLNTLEHGFENSPSDLITNYIVTHYD